MQHLLEDLVIFPSAHIIKLAKMLLAQKVENCQQSSMLQHVSVMNSVLPFNPKYASQTAEVKFL